MRTIESVAREALALGVDQLRAAGTPLNPLLLLFAAEGPPTLAILGVENDEEMMTGALSAIAAAPAGVTHCALVFDTRVGTAEGGKRDALSVMACARGGEGELWVRTYRATATGQLAELLDDGERAGATRNLFEASKGAKPLFPAAPRSFLYEATGSDGRRVAARVEAASTAEARAKLEREGHIDILFHTDEFDGDDPLRDLGIDVRGEDEVAARRGGGLWGPMLRAHAKTLGPLLAWNILSFVGDRPFGWGDWLGFVLTALYAAFLAVLVVPAYLFNGILAAQLWGRWRESLRLHAVLQRWPLLATPKHQFALFAAKAHAALGERERAFAIIDRWRDAIPEHTWLAYRQSVHYLLREHDEMFAAIDRMAELLPDSALPQVELAMQTARFGRDPARAHAALARIDTLEKTPLVSAGALYARGLLALRGGDARAALALLLETHEAVRAVGENPQMRGWLAEVQAYTAAAMMLLGRRAEGDRHYRAVLPLLRAQRCHEAMEAFALAASGRLAKAA